MPFDDAELGLTDPDAVRSAPRPSHCSVFKDRAPQFGREERFYHRPSTGASELRAVDRSDRRSMGNPRPRVKREPSPSALPVGGITARWLPEPDQASTRRTNRRPTWSVRPTSAVRATSSSRTCSPSTRTAPSAMRRRASEREGSPRRVHEQRREVDRRVAGERVLGRVCGDLAAAEDRAEALRGRVGRRRPVVPARDRVREAPLGLHGLERAALQRRHRRGALLVEPRGQAQPLGHRRVGDRHRLAVHARRAASVTPM